MTLPCVQSSCLGWEKGVQRGGGAGGGGSSPSPSACESMRVRSCGSNLKEDEGVEHQGVGANVPFYLLLVVLKLGPLRQKLEVLHATACCLATCLVLFLRDL